MATQTHTPAPLAKGWPWALLFGVFFALEFGDGGLGPLPVAAPVHQGCGRNPNPKAGLQLFAGLALFSTGPVLAVLLMITLVGLPLGLLLLVVYKLLGIMGWPGESLFQLDKPSSGQGTPVDRYLNQTNGDAMEAQEKTVLDAMHQAGKPVKGAEIAKATGLDPKEVSKIINALKKAGKITSPKVCFYEPV